MENNQESPGFKVDFSKRDVSSELNGLFKNLEWQGMLVAKNYCFKDSVFQFIACLFDRLTFLTDEVPMKNVHTDC